MTIRYILHPTISVIILIICLSVVENGYAVVNKESIVAVWPIDEGVGDVIEDAEGVGIMGKIKGATWVDALGGKGLSFDGDDMIRIPGNPALNTGGPYKNRTVMVLFNAQIVTNQEKKQVLYEEGGAERGFNIYIDSGKLYVGGWNTLEYNWPGSWLSTRISRNRWYYAALVLRGGSNKVEKDKFEMWLNGKIVEKGSGGQVFTHLKSVAIGAVDWETVFHDGLEPGTKVHNFNGTIGEARIYNAALSENEMKTIVDDGLTVDFPGTLAASWGKVKAGFKLY